MRVLVISTAGVGHIYPMVPLASALQGAGHELVWAVPPEAVATIRSFGMRAQPVGVNPRADTPEAAARRSELLLRLANSDPRHHRFVLWPMWFAGIQGTAMLADLRPVAGSWRPDVVIYEPNAVAAAPLAARRRIPHVAVGYGGFVPQVVLDSAEDQLRSLWLAEELDLPPSAGLYDDLYLHPFPDSFGPPPPTLTVHPMRPDGFDGASSTDRVPEWLAPLGQSQPCVYITYGTVVASQAPFQAVFDAFGALDADAVLTTGPGVDTESLPSKPPNVRVTGYLPQRFILDESSLVVSHAGSGAVLGALSRGIPQLCMPMSADQFVNADLVTAAGCGLSLDSPDVTSHAISESVTRLLDDRVFTSNAGTVAAQIGLMPAPEDLVTTVAKTAI